ncbi:RICIN domain-containing protein [Compostimonas suwonensis]|uniref:Ricin-type beta-trefoil lectin protein n=1 Tax=Compostimonas suwonensis TaxID=1048394 RepID=A0A2M9BCI5_9MICO|nr:RICIN domain-containing protein [Compostimonas suwonensis]PJJ55655.1 ricin-type beta-trefoil lectin protein [Compostimonas suwonensis]
MKTDTTPMPGRDRRSRPARARMAVLGLLTTAVMVLGGLSATSIASAVTTGNGALVFSPAAGTSFDPEGTRPVGTTYAKIVSLKNSGASNGTQLVTFDQLVLVGGVQVYPIYRSTDDGASWTKVADIAPSSTFPALTRTAQPFLYELPQQVGDLPAGTILLSGMIMPADRSSSRLVVYKSLDHGVTWSFQSTIDTGGPAVYDPSPSSTTTTVWEPSLAVAGDGSLVAYFSDERQKASGVLQAISYRRSTDGGLTWGPLVNVSAPTNSSDRPGMITVTKLPDGRYLATYEVVNRPSQSLNTAPVYAKYSPDGLNWSPTTSIGTPIQLANGRGIGSSPFVKWVPTGGPKGMVVVSSKWSLDAAGNINPGQNFYVNYNLGEGPWERLPYAVTYDSTDTQGGAFSGFAQGFDTSPDGRTLFQATNVENPTTTYNDIRVGSIPLDAQQYEAERATRVDTSLVTHHDASNGSKVGNINNPGSTVTFSVRVPAAGSYTLNVRYDNGTGAASTHTVTVNGVASTAISYPPTVDWGRFAWAQKTVTLNAGLNTIAFGKGTSFAELDVLQVYRPTVATDPQFRVVNRNSGKFLEILSALTTDGAGAGQWGDTSNATQVWNVATVSGGVQLSNANSGKLLEIPSSSLADGTQAVQRGSTGLATQRWAAATSGGWWTLTNANSGKLLEVASGSLADGAVVQQWTANGCTCQQWRLTREGIQ